MKLEMELCNSGQYLPSINKRYKKIFEKTNYNPEGKETVFSILYMIFLNSGEK